MEETALAKTDPQLVTVPTKGGNGERIVARATDGKFAKKHSAAVKKSIRNTIDFLEGKDDGSDKTRAERMREALYQAVISASPEDLVGMTKALEAFNKFAFGSKGVDRVVEQSDPESNAIRVILITSPTLPTKEEKPLPSKPSWIDAEVVK